MAADTGKSSNLPHVSADARKAFLRRLGELLRLLQQAGERDDALDLDEELLTGCPELRCVPLPLLQAWVRHTESLCSRAVGTNRRVAVLGPEFSYSHLAAIAHFGMAVDVATVATIEAAFEEVRRGHSTHAVVPIENSTDGRIVDTLSCFARAPQQVCGEILFSIHHCLLARCSRDAIREVRSKPQALSQCRRWLASHLPEARLVEVPSTAVAAQDAARMEGVAAIASREAGVAARIADYRGKHRRQRP
ncbi:MAG: hypothetical protein KatS3mg111_0791 [Pirellulaceae bacterium]|nr:MAG: hypothetical protein KatS3mg111_0791 [Pirellulaceae bacterium]